MRDDIVKRLREPWDQRQSRRVADEFEAADIITALRAEVERLKAERDAAMMTGHDLAKEEYRDKLQAAEAERDRLREALEWYANKFGWYVSADAKGNISVGICVADGGKRARAAITTKGDADERPRNPTE